MPRGKPRENLFGKELRDVPPRADTEKTPAKQVEPVVERSKPVAVAAVPTISVGHVKPKKAAIAKSVRCSLQVKRTPFSFEDEYRAEVSTKRK